MKTFTLALGILVNIVLFIDAFGYALNYQERSIRAIEKREAFLETALPWPFPSFTLPPKAIRRQDSE